MPESFPSYVSAGARLQYVALDSPALLALDVAVGGAAVVRLARPDLAHQVEEHLRPHTTRILTTQQNRSSRSPSPDSQTNNLMVISQSQHRT